MPEENYWWDNEGKHLSKIGRIHVKQRWSERGITDDILYYVTKLDYRKKIIYNITNRERIYI